MIRSSIYKINLAQDVMTTKQHNIDMREVKLCH